MDIWFKTTLAAGGELGLRPTHEEPLTHLMRDYISSYKDLPIYVYHFKLNSAMNFAPNLAFFAPVNSLKDLYSFPRPS